MSNYFIVFYAHEGWKLQPKRNKQQQKTSAISQIFIISIGIGVNTQSPQRASPGPGVFFIFNLNVCDG